MELISNYLSKPVISIYEASMAGTVINATFDKKMRRICALLLVSDNDEEEIVYSIPINRIVTVDNALTVKNKNAVKLYEESNIFVKSPINLPVFTTNGLSKGIIKDVSFDNKTFEVIELCLDTGNLPASCVISISNSLVIIKGEGFTKLQPPRARRVKKINKPVMPVIPLEEEKIIPDIENEETAAEENIIEEIEEASTVFEEEKVNIPARIISDYSFLLDRIVLANVYSVSGELIIPANSKITVPIVEKARRYGKLVELTVGSRLV